jgi:Tat protein translocase TatB subunit
MPSSLGPAEILVILLVALIVLGPTKLPGAARQVGKTLAEVRKWSQGFQDEIRSVIDSEVAPSYPPQPSPEPTPIPMLPADTNEPPPPAAAPAAPAPPRRAPPVHIPMLPAPTVAGAPAPSANGMAATNGHGTGPVPVDPPSTEHPGPPPGEPPRT